MFLRDIVGVSKKGWMYLMWEDLTIMVPNFGNRHTKRLLNRMSGYAKQKNHGSMLRSCGYGLQII